MWDIIQHRWLRVPYALNVRTKRVVQKPRQIVLFIHGIGTSGDVWNEVIASLPDDITVITIDLLGFGKSPKPSWAVYSAKTQARSVIATLLKLGGLPGRPIIVGHSLGALVAVEVAKRYPLIVRSLILCSPPFYNDQVTRRIIPESDQMLKNLFRLSQKHPEEFVRISAIALKYNLVNKAFDLTNDNVDTYMAALDAAIINQTSLSDAKKLKKRMRIIHGSFDPVVIKRNLKDVAAANKFATLTTILAGHEVKGPYVGAVVKAVTDAAENKK